MEFINKAMNKDFTVRFTQGQLFRYLTSVPLLFLSSTKAEVNTQEALCTWGLEHSALQLTYPQAILTAHLSGLENLTVINLANPINTLVGLQDNVVYYCSGVDVAKNIDESVNGKPVEKGTVKDILDKISSGELQVKPGQGITLKLEYNDKPAKEK